MTPPPRISSPDKQRRELLKVALWQRTEDLSKKSAAMAAYSKTKHTMPINNQLIALLICEKVGREKAGLQLTKFFVNMRIKILLRVDLFYGIADLMRVDHITFYNNSWNFFVMFDSGCRPDFS